MMPNFFKNYYLAMTHSSNTKLGYFYMQGLTKQNKKNMNNFYPNWPVFNILLIYYGNGIPDLYINCIPIHCNANTL